MAQSKRYTRCPRCAERGADTRGDNLHLYPDGSAHCFACRYHVFPKNYVKKEVVHESPTAPIPPDFTREVPARCWKWLLQYGLPYSYWKPYCGYSPSTERLVITHGSPIEVSVGRYVGSDAGEGTGEPPRKWREWGTKYRSATLLEPTSPCEDERIVCVEDIISAHVCRQVVTSLPLFGTALYPRAIQALRALKRPVALWLDLDQYGVLAPKINRLQTFLDVPVSFIKTRKDPKKHSLDELKEILYANQAHQKS